MARWSGGMILGAMMVLAGCGNGPPPVASSSGPSQLQVVTGTTAKSTVSETDALKFVPATLTVAAGTVVEWKNSGTVQHNVTFDEGTASDTMQNGDTFEVKFANAGSYHYVCTFHVSSGMTGTVTVTS